MASVAVNTDREVNRDTAQRLSRVDEASRQIENVALLEHMVGARVLGRARFDRAPIPCPGLARKRTRMHRIMNHPSLRARDLKHEEPAPKPSRDADVRVESIDELVEFFTAAGKKGVAINRYKGLGEMNPDTLWETTMNPDRATLAQVRPKITWKPT